MPQIKDKVSNFFAWARGGKSPVSVDVARREDPDAPPNKEVTLHQLKEGYGEVVETMKSVRSHLEEQSGRSQQMLELMRDLPEVLRSIPEGTRTQTRMLEAIHTNLQQQNETSGQLTSAITGLASAAEQQERTLTQIGTHLADEDQTRGQLNRGVTALNDTLGHVMDSNAATRDSMGAVVEQNRVNDERMRQMFQRSQKMNTAMVLLCLALATGALALGGYMAFMVSRVVDPAAPQPSVPTSSDALPAGSPYADLAAPGAAAGPAADPGRDSNPGSDSSPAPAPETTRGGDASAMPASSLAAPLFSSNATAGTFVPPMAETANPVGESSILPSAAVADQAAPAAGPIATEPPDFFQPVGPPPPAAESP